MTIYHTINWFFALSFIGYLLECTVLSYENRRPVLNRGFGHGPFCVIYGFGALGACLILEPLAGQPVELYFASMVMATSMELVTAHIMIKLFGAFWWDYSRKPFNYRGIICLESSLAWGFLGLFFFYFLDARVRQAVRMIPGDLDSILAVGLTVFYLIDFIVCVRARLGGEDDGEPVIGRLKIY